MHDDGPRLWEFAQRFESIGVCEVDSSRRVKRCNQAFALLVGRDIVSIIGKKIIELTATDGQLDANKRLDALLSGTVDRVCVEKRYVKPSGATVLGRLESLVQKLDNGETYILSFLAPLPDLLEDERVGVLEASVNDMRLLINALSPGVNITMTAGNSNIATGNATASQDNSRVDTNRVENVHTEKAKSGTAFWAIASAIGGAFITVVGWMVLHSDSVARLLRILRGTDQ